MVEYAMQNIKEVYKKYGYEEAKKVAETWQRRIAIDSKKILEELHNDK